MATLTRGFLKSTQLRYSMGFMHPVLELREVSKRYRDYLAVDRVSLAVPKGAFFSLLGPSGCGKTTTLRLIAGFESPSSGEIRLKGDDIGHLPPYRRNVNTVFQSYALFPHLTVRRNIQFGLQRQKAASMDERILSVIEQLQLSGKELRLPSELSGGEKQRVALARALVLQPDVLLLDEPLSALDPQLRKQIRSELKDLQRKVGITFLFVTHDQEEALSMSDQIAVMNQGRVEQVGPPEEIYQRPRTRFVATFLGELNQVAGAWLRPESLRLVKGTPSGRQPTRKGTVTRTTFLGPVVQVEVVLEDAGKVIVRTPASEMFAIGETVYATWDESDQMRFVE